MFLDTTLTVYQRERDNDEPLEKCFPHFLSLMTKVLLESTIGNCRLLKWEFLAKALHVLSFHSKNDSRSKSNRRKFVQTINRYMSVNFPNRNISLSHLFQIVDKKTRSKHFLVSWLISSLKTIFEMNFFVLRILNLYYFILFHCINIYHY